MCSTPTVRHIKVTGLLTRGQWIYKITVSTSVKIALRVAFKHKYFASSKRK